MDSRRDSTQDPADAINLEGNAPAKAAYHPPVVQRLDMGLGTHTGKQFGGSEVTTPGYRGGPATS